MPRTYLGKKEKLKKRDRPGACTSSTIREHVPATTGLLEGGKLTGIKANRIGFGDKIIDIHFEESVGGPA